MYLTHTEIFYSMNVFFSKFIRVFYLAVFACHKDTENFLWLPVIMAKICNSRVILMIYYFGKIISILKL